jgi:hypothetical protein
MTRARAHLPTASIHTAAGLHNASRRADRKRAGVAHFLAEMKRGASLHLKYANGGRALWSLSNGQFVPADVAALLINDASVVSVGDALFPDTMPSQTWRIIQ